MSAYRASPGHLADYLARRSRARRTEARYGRCSKRRPLPDFFRTLATSQLSLSVAGKSRRNERPPALLALERRMDNQLADIDHVHDVDGVQPFVVRDGALRWQSPCRAEHRDGSARCRRAPIAGRRHSSRRRLCPTSCSRSFSLTLTGADAAHRSELRNRSSRAVPLRISLSDSGRLGQPSRNRPQCRRQPPCRRKWQARSTRCCVRRRRRRRKAREPTSAWSRYRRRCRLAGNATVTAVSTSCLREIAGRAGGRSCHRSCKFRPRPASQ